MGPQAIICDIDDTVFEEDNNYKPIKNVIEFLQHHAQNYKIIMMKSKKCNNYYLNIYRSFIVLIFILKILK